MNVSTLKTPNWITGFQYWQKLWLAPVLLLLISMPASSHGQGSGGALADLVRGMTKVPDAIPINKMDGMVESMNRTAREALNKELVATGKTVTRVERAAEVLRLLRSTSAGVDPGVIRKIELLDDASREMALVLARGSKTITSTIPDIASRGRFLTEGGAETVAMVGLKGPDAARAAVRLDEAIRGGTVFVKEGGRMVNLADFGSVMVANGSWEFWSRYVAPHWKIWAASGAMAAYLVNPEFFQNAAGELTQAGIERLTILAGSVASGVIAGIGTGSGIAVEKVGDAIWKTFFRPESWLVVAIGSVIFLGFASLVFRRIRHWALSPFKWLNKVPPTDVKE